jgi:putative FmdB family regulatory protein
MIYEYRCSECERVLEKKMGMLEEHPASIKCKECGGTAYRYFGNAKVHIPGNFKATSEIYGGDNAGNFDFIKSRMKHGTRPSGKTKVLY